ncbi:hypothetical protein KIS4809_5466 [Bacillus sp. ZZV12-4809]|nr:hypothetical protein KIS4809_5466 [Bacillus sp. ZZV12-4809]
MKIGGLLRFSSFFFVQKRGSRILDKNRRIKKKIREQPINRQQKTEDC